MSIQVALALLVLLATTMAGPMTRRILKRRKAQGKFGGFELSERHSIAVLTALAIWTLIPISLIGLMVLAFLVFAR